MAAENTQAIAATAKLKTFGTITAVGLLGAVIVSAFTHDFGFDGKTLFGDGGNAPYAGAKDGLSKTTTDGVNPPHEVSVEVIPADAREALKRQAYENAARGGSGSGASSNNDALPAEWVAVVNGYRERQDNAAHKPKPQPESVTKKPDAKHQEAEQRAHDVSVKVVPKEEAILRGLGWGEVKATPSWEEKPLAHRIKENETKAAYGHKEEGGGKDLEAKLKSMGRVKFCATYGKNEAAWYCNGDTQKIARYDYAPTVAVK